MTRAEKWAQHYRKDRPEEVILTTLAGLGLHCLVENDGSFVLRSSDFTATMPAVFVCLPAPEARLLCGFLQRNYIEDVT